ncbi:MAG: bifunctional phosphopantothenoylcysteine decarboxylase/phosphopantothenate--cysteine ligase CoaBC, partial [Cyanobacteria bacterium J069]
ADNLLTNTVLASTCPVLLAPAMNTDMWEQQSVQRNWRLVQEDGRFHAVGPGSGRLACDRLGSGRMAEPADLVAHLESLRHTRGQRDLAGKQILINTGSTREFLDPVRFIGNPSTGKMGLALAQAAQHRGATVTLVHGPMSAELLNRSGGDRRLPITSAADLHQAMLSELPTADWIILAAAVADVKPAEFHPHKLPKADLPDALPLAPVPDIAADLGQRKHPHQRLIGFAAQTGDIVSPAFDKLQRKRLDAIAANPIDQLHSGFGSDQNQAVFLDKYGRKEAIAPCSKLQMAHLLYDFVRDI